MPLLKFFSRAPLRMDVAAVHLQLSKSWNVPAELNTTPLQFVFTTQAEMYPSAACFIDVRAKAKPERTPAYLEERMKELTEIVRQATGNPSDTVRVRIELFDPSLSYSKCFDAEL